MRLAAGASTMRPFATARPHLEPGDTVGGEQRDQAVVGVRIGEHGRFAARRGRARLVVQHPQEALRIAHPIGEEGRCEIERHGQCPEQIGGDPECRLLVARDDRPK